MEETRLDTVRKCGKYTYNWLGHHFGYLRLGWATSSTSTLCHVLELAKCSEYFCDTDVFQPRLCFLMLCLSSRFPLLHCTRGTMVLMNSPLRCIAYRHSRNIRAQRWIRRGNFLSEAIITRPDFTSQGIPDVPTLTVEKNGPAELKELLLNLPESQWEEFWAQVQNFQEERKSKKRCRLLLPP